MEPLPPIVASSGKTLVSTVVNLSSGEKQAAARQVVLQATGSARDGLLHVSPPGDSLGRQDDVVASLAPRDTKMDVVDGVEEPGSSGRGRKRQRKTTDQVAVLEAHFLDNPLPDKAMRDRLGLQLGLTTRQVQIWFQNKRAKAKQEQQQQQQQPTPQAAHQPPGPPPLLPTAASAASAASAAVALPLASVSQAMSCSPAKRKRSALIDATAAVEGARQVSGVSSREPPPTVTSAHVPGPVAPVCQQHLPAPLSSTATRGTVNPAGSVAVLDPSTCPLHGHLHAQQPQYNLAYQPRQAKSPMQESSHLVQQDEHSHDLRLDGKSPSQLCLEFELQNLLLEYLEKDMTN